MLMGRTLRRIPISVVVLLLLFAYASANSAFKEVQISGSAFTHASLRHRSCFRIIALDKSGQVLDKDDIQRAAFSGMLTAIEDPKDPLTKLFVSMDITYHPAQSSHEACYRVDVQASYTLQIFLDFKNAWEIENTLDKKNAAGYARHNCVAQSTVTIVPDHKRLLFISRDQNPQCSFPQLLRSTNAGYWTGVDWIPYDCDFKAPSLDDIFTLFDGKSVLFLGDSQMRYMWATLWDLLRRQDRDKFLRRECWRPGRFAKMEIPWEQSNHRKMKDYLESWPNGRIRYSEGRTKTGTWQFYGTQWLGFGHYQLWRTVTEGGKAAVKAFNVTYYAQLGASYSLWGGVMEDASITRGPTSLTYAPFDYAFVSLGLNDLPRLPNATAFAFLLRSSYLPALKLVTKGPETVTFVGMWAAQIAPKPLKFIHGSNNVRACSFETQQIRVLKEEGYHNFISTQHMTFPRRDLCADSTHYSWPVSLATWDLYFFCLIGSQTSV